ncbi:hypothetical protein B0H14DRAFT_2556694 [Mycena olivaceomarginata]|nr:hypothetical protein B0H14DRAFT_2556694 [Mycena olivaceomarginata]
MSPVTSKSSLGQVFKIRRIVYQLMYFKQLITENKIKMLCEWYMKTYPTVTNDVILNAYRVYYNRVAHIEEESAIVASMQELETYAVARDACEAASNLNGERCKIAMRALLDEVVNQIGSALSAVLKAWEAHLRKPKHLDPITATYLGDHSTVRMVLGVDAAGKQLRGDGDAAAHEFNEDQFRKYCSSTILPLDIRTQIQHSFSFLFPSAALLDFKTL